MKFSSITKDKSFYHYFDIFYNVKFDYIYIKKLLLFNLLILINSILIGHNEVLKISDFGTSKQWNDKSMKMSFAGTVSWMAPEVIRNEMCTEKVDIW